MQKKPRLALVSRVLRIGGRARIWLADPALVPLICLSADLNLSLACIMASDSENSVCPFLPQEAGKGGGGGGGATDGT